MNWTELITDEIEENVAAARGLISMIDSDSLSWKPESGSNWMTNAQLLHHVATACGMPIKCFVTGEWPPMPEDGNMLPPAEAMESVESVEQALSMLEEDKKLALEMLAVAGEERLSTEMVAPPWYPDKPILLGQNALHMAQHLAQHKAQLFYYLKLQGKDVNTWTLFGG